MFALAKEDEFEAIAVAAGGVDVAGVIPPLGPIVGVVEVIARELVVVTGDDFAELRVRGQGCHGGKECQRTEHLISLLS